MTVRWSEAAAEQIASIRDFIARDSRRNAERIAEQLVVRGDSIGPGPESGSIVPELDRKDIRAAIFPAGDFDGKLQSGVKVAHSHSRRLTFGSIVLPSRDESASQAFQCPGSRRSPGR